MDIDDIEQEIATEGNENHDSNTLNTLMVKGEDNLRTLSRQGQTRQTKKGKRRRVSFPEDHCLVSKSVEPFDPWANASNATSTEVIKSYMNACARLRVKPIDKVVKQLKEHEVFHSRINILDLKGIKLDVKSCEALEEIFKRVQVHTLSIENTNLEDEGAIAIIEMIEFYHSAVHICIGYNPRIKTRGWQIFSQMIRKAPFIEFVDVRHCCFNDPCTAVMARSLKLNTTLRILHLEGDNLSGKLLLILCTGIKFNQAITELFLGDNFLVASDANTLAAMLKSNATVQLLDVRNNMLQDQGVLQLCDGLSQQKQSGVRTLVLWNNQITRNGMIPMSNLLAITHHIQTLNIGHNRLANDGIRNLQIGLLKNKSLLRLGLLNTKMTAEGAVALAEYVADTRTLLRLDLRENDLFVGGLMALTLAVKINETVVRIDLDKDLKKEQGMEGTQTSLLVDIYQYLERNKKLGIEREKLRCEQQELHDEQEQQKTIVDDVTSSSDVTVIVNIEPSDDVASGDDNIKFDTEDGESCDTNVRGNLGEGTDANCVESCRNHVGSSRFVVSPVRDERKNLEEEINDNEHDNLLTENVGTGADGSSRLLSEELPDDIEEISDPENFEKELDELLANVSAVNTSDHQDNKEVWEEGNLGVRNELILE